MVVKQRAVFLDRDGVIVEDRGLILAPEDFHVLPGVAEALTRLHASGFLRIVVSNQAVVARGLLSEPEVQALHAELEARLQAAGVPPLDGFYYCPHHPAATLPAYRVDCSCRKPRPGLLLQAAQDFDLDLAASFMVGDRPTDLQAGVRAGCRSVWVQTGRHGDRPIESAEPLDPGIRAAFVGTTLSEAVDWILEAP